MVKICICGHRDIDHLKNKKCISEIPNNHKDHDREGEIMVPCTCKKLVIAIDSSLSDIYVIKGVFSSNK